MGKTLKPPIRRNMASQVTRQPANPAPPPRVQHAPAAAPKPVGSADLRAFAKEDEAELRQVLDGAYDVPGLSFPTPPGILDVGAHAGSATNFFLRRWPACSIQAFEPHPEAARSFQENTRESGWSVTLHTLAVVGADWPDRRGLLFDGLRAPWNRSLYQLGAQLTTGVQVDTRRAATLPEADVLKLATSGCELSILDSYPYMMRLRAVMLRCYRKSDYKPLIERLVQSGLTLVRDESHHGETPGAIVYARQ